MKEVDTTNKSKVSWGIPPYCIHTTSGTGNGKCELNATLELGISFVDKTNRGGYSTNIATYTDCHQLALKPGKCDIAAVHVLQDHDPQ